MGFPWSAWFSSLDGNVWPLLFAVAFQACYYFYGLYRLLGGRSLLPECENVSPETI